MVMVSATMQFYKINTVQIPEIASIPEGSDTRTLPEDRGFQAEPFDTRKIRIEPKAGNMYTLLEMLQNGTIVLHADLQRQDGIWDEVSQSRLMESLMLYIPVPGFYFDASVDYRRWLVVDGFQRLTAIERFVIRQDLRLCGLEYLKEHDGKTFSELPRPLQRAILNTGVVWYLVMPGTPEEMRFELYRRINTSSQPLSAQEIRHVLNGKPVTDFIGDLAESEVFRQVTVDSLSGKRMDDRECVTRFLVFAVFPPEDYRKDDFDAFLNKGMRYLNGHSEILQGLCERFLRAMRAAGQIFGNDAFRRRYNKAALRYPLNKALFESWSITLDACSDKELEILVQRKDLLKEKFIDLMVKDIDFNKSVMQQTGSSSRVRYRFSKVSMLVEEMLHD